MNQASHGGKREGSGSKPRMVAVGKTLTFTPPEGSGLLPMTFVIDEFDGERALCVDQDGQAWTITSEYEILQEKQA